jgi:hypothetical protein
MTPGDPDAAAPDDPAPDIDGPDVDAADIDGEVAADAAADAADVVVPDGDPPEEHPARTATAITPHASSAPVDRPLIVPTRPSM